MLDVVHVYDPFITRTTTISEKKSFMTHFLLCSYLRAHPTNLLLKILGGQMHGSSPTSNFLGAVPTIFPRSPPLFLSIPFHSITFNHIVINSSTFYAYQPHRTIIMIFQWALVSRFAKLKHRK